MFKRLSSGRRATCSQPTGWHAIEDDCSRYVRADRRGLLHEVTANKKCSHVPWCYRCVSAIPGQQYHETEGPFANSSLAMAYAMARERTHRRTRAPLGQGQLNKSPRSLSRGGRMAREGDPDEFFLGRKPVPDWAANLQLTAEVWVRKTGEKPKRVVVATLEYYHDLDELKPDATRAAAGLAEMFQIKAPGVDAGGATYEVRLVASRVADRAAVWTSAPAAVIPQRIPALMAAQSIAESFGRIEDLKPGRRRG